MKTLKITQLKIENFKGIKRFDLTLSNHETFVGGDNGTGKTSIFDAFLWLLFGKDSEGKSDFEIKTLDSDGKVINNLEHSVEAVLSINNGESVEQVILKKIYREKWTKKRGTNVLELTGHENLFYWNEVPMKEGEYKKTVSQIVGDETLFKLLTNPLYFNTQLKWEARRKALLEMCSPVTNEQVLNSIDFFLQEKNWLIGRFSNNLTFDNIKAEISHKITNLNKDLKDIPVRIDEAFKAIPSGIDYDAIRAQITDLEAKISKLNKDKESMVSAQNIKHEEALKIDRRRYEIKSAMQKIKHECSEAHTDKINRLKVEIVRLNNVVSKCDTDITNLIYDLQSHAEHKNNNNTKLTALRDTWQLVSAETFPGLDKKDTVCYACGKEHDADKVEASRQKAEQAWKQNKADRLADIEDSGKALRDAVARLDKLQKDIMVKVEEHEVEKAKHQEIIPELAKQLNELEAMSYGLPDEYSKLENELQLLPENIATADHDFTNINTVINQHAEELKKLSNELAGEALGEQIMQRIASLNEQEKTIVQEIAGLESKMYLLELFNKAKIELLISSVNDKFKFVRFKLFDEQLNGGISECCDTLINTNGSWVPYQSANNAGRINAGIDIINAMSNHYGIMVPIIIDNREGVNDLIHTDTQVLNLVVTRDKNLNIFE